MVNREFEPAEKEEQVLDVFKNDRETVNPMYLREQTELGKGDINTALTRLTSAGWVRKITRGLYEFVEDPRSETTPGQMGGGETRRDEELSTPEDTYEPEDTDSTAGRGQPTDSREREGDDDLAARVAAHVAEEDIPPKTNHGRSAALDVFRELRQAGTLKTSELQARVYDGYEDQWSDGRTMWNAIDRHLEKIPGVQKGGYGEWEYAGDDEVAAEIGSN